ncbi:MAG: PilZ domain-containing protein [Polyangiaceae bacterium]
MNERRRDRRLPISLPVTLKLGKKPLTGETTNVSFHGLGLRVEGAVNVRQLVQLEAQLPSGKILSAHTMVVHSANGFVGLEFFGRGANAEWDEFVQGLLRSAGASMPPPGGPAPNLPPVMGLAPPPMPSTNPNLRAPVAPMITPPQGHAIAGDRVSGLPPPVPLAPSGWPGTNPNVATPPPAPAAPPPRTAPSQPPAPPQPPPRSVTSPVRQPYAGPERRRAPRIEMQIELRLRTPRSIHVGFTVDVSMLGATVATQDIQVQPGESVVVNLIQPGTNFSFRRDGIATRLVAIEGNWSHVGVAFNALDPTREVMFAEFMNTAYSTLFPGG